MGNDNRGLINGKKALETVKKFISTVGWIPLSTDIDEVLAVDFRSEGLPISEILFDVRAYYERFLVYFNFKQSISEKYKQSVTEFVTRANYDLIIGNFELDLDSGVIRFKSSVDFTMIELSDTLIRNTLKSGMDIVEVYAEALVEVNEGKKTAIEAIQAAENGLYQFNWNKQPKLDSNSRS